MELEATWICIVLGVFTIILSMTGTEGLAVPHIITSGTHYEIGHDIGKTFKEEIHEYFKLHPLLYSKFIPWSETSVGKQELSNYIAQMETHFPQYVQELKGISEGADVPLNQVYMLVFQVEIATLISSLPKAPTECSDVYVSDPSKSLITICHNEDTLPIVKTRGYFVTANIYDPADYPGSRIKTKTENFTHFSYPGILPGNAFGFNQHGLIQTVNALYPREVLTNRTGRYVLSRALLSAENIDEVKNILTDEGTGCAYGISLNIGILPTSKNRLPLPEIWNFEVAPNPKELHTIVNASQIPVQGPGFGYHVNKYERIEIDQNPEKINSSIHRAARIKAIVQSQGIPSNNQEILAILGDQEDKEFPIYRVPSQTDKGCTVATGLFDLKEKKLKIFRDNPGKSAYGPVAHFDLP